VNEFFPYRGGELHAEDVPIEQIAAAVGTPFYLYSAAGLASLYHRFADAFAPVRPLVCYAVKANSNQAVIATLAKLGAGADVVSGGELKRALAAGVPPKLIPGTDVLCLKTVRCRTLRHAHLIESQH